MNKKGFTLIELIATITILSIIMMVAIPNVISITKKNKNQTYINDARKMVTLAKYRFESDASIPRPTNTNPIIILLNALDKSELQKGPENGTYDTERSFVKIIYDSTKNTYVYSVQIAEKLNDTETDTNQYRGIVLTEYSNITNINAKNSYITSGKDTKFPKGTTLQSDTSRLIR